ncbi:MAG: hypothetical protein P0Y65_12740 [Candidatus Devosia phytovorans]|uniref:Peptidase S74 domain-containing protein n=1 Tax=Candidatus Devosia phytovorans TaxID=3121372 RepID=A0AAJ5VS14_9HYPH|nr:hypothetical protein [Devosia sp.]WEK03070.1 MAG: hypothetical protein P0Y65_12740 [Devosia sp.]
MAIGATSKQSKISQIFSTLSQVQQSPLTSSVAQGQKQAASTLTAVRGTAVSNALTHLNDALSSAKFQAQVGGAMDFEPINETYKSWRKQDVFQDRSKTVKDPIYETREKFRTEDVFEDRAIFEDVPVYEMQDVYETRDITETRDVYEKRPVYEDRDVYETRNTYGTRDVYETRPTYEDRDVYETRNTYGTRDVYETRPTYENRDIYETRNTYGTRDVYETRPAFRTEDVREAVINGGKDISAYIGNGNNGVFSGSSFHVDVAGKARATVTYTQNGVSVTQGGVTTNFNKSANETFAQALVHGVNSIDGLDATMVGGKLHLKGAENSAVTLSMGTRGLGDYLGGPGPLGALGLVEGTTQPAKTGTREVPNGTQQVKVGTEQYVTGTEQVKVGTERVQTGTEQVKTGEEQYVTGTEQVKTGTERIQTGTEQVKTGEEQYVTGTEQVKTGTERVQTGEEDVLIGSEEVVVGSEQVVVGQQQVQVGTEQRQTGTESVLVGTRQVADGTEQVIAGYKDRLVTEKVRTGQKDVSTEKTRLVGFRRVQEKPDDDPRMTLDTQRAIRDGLLLLQNAVGPREFSKGVANPYAKVGDAINIDRLLKADSKKDIATALMTVPAMLAQIKKSTQAYQQATTKTT